MDPRLALFDRKFNHLFERQIGVGKCVPGRLVYLMQNLQEGGLRLKFRSNRQSVQKIANKRLHFRTIAICEGCSDDKIRLSGEPMKPDLETCQKYREQCCLLFAS